MSPLCIIYIRAAGKSDVRGVCVTPERSVHWLPGNSAGFGIEENMTMINDEIGQLAARISFAHKDAVTVMQVLALGLLGGLGPVSTRRS